MTHLRLHALLLAAAALVPVPAPAWTVFLNELHYDNAGSDVDEGFEVAGPAGTDLAGWSVVLYNGNSGADYGTVPLAGVIPDEAGGFGALGFLTGSLQNGAPDGLALVSDAGQVNEFLSYEGGFTASGGPAAGLASLDIGVLEDGTDPAGLSLQLAGAGMAAADFVWTGPLPASFGVLNAAQAITASPVPLPPAVWLMLGATGLVTVLRSRAHRPARAGGPGV